MARAWQARGTSADFVECRRGTRGRAGDADVLVALSGAGAGAGLEWSFTKNSPNRIELSQIGGSDPSAHFKGRLRRSLRDERIGIGTGVGGGVVPRLAP
jgi:hypothetical protein